MEPRGGTFDPDLDTRAGATAAGALSLRSKIVSGSWPTRSWGCFSGLARLPSCENRWPALNGHVRLGGRLRAHRDRLPPIPLSGLWRDRVAAPIAGCTPARQSPPAGRPADWRRHLLPGLKVQLVAWLFVLMAALVLGFAAALEARR